MFVAELLQNKVIVVLLAGFILFLIMDKVACANREKREKEARRLAFEKEIKSLIAYQDSLYLKYEALRKKAELYEDLRTMELIDETCDMLREIIEEFNEQIFQNEFFEKVMELFANTRHRMDDIRNRFRDAERKLQDLREAHHGTKEEQEQWEECQKRQWQAIPLAGSRYFRGCRTRKDLVKRYHALVKMYHPDNGGDLIEFRAIKEEYEDCKKELTVSL